MAPTRKCEFSGVFLKPRFLTLVEGITSQTLFFKNKNQSLSLSLYFYSNLYIAHYFLKLLQRTQAKNKISRSQPISHPSAEPVEILIIRPPQKIEPSGPTPCDMGRKYLCSFMQDSCHLYGFTFGKEWHGKSEIKLQNPALLVNIGLWFLLPKLCTLDY